MRKKWTVKLRVTSCYRHGDGFNELVENYSLQIESCVNERETLVNEKKKQTIGARGEVFETRNVTKPLCKTFFEKGAFFE